jgi:DNA-binding beta-propeller fold protein YncE
MNTRRFAKILLLLGAIGVAAAPSRPAAGAAGSDSQGDLKGTVWVVNRDKGQLAIFDAETGTLATPLIDVGTGAHDVCISEQVHKAYITAEADNAVTVIDTDTLEKTSIRVVPLPHHIEPSNDGHTLYVSLASHNTSVGSPRYAAIDVRDDSVTYVTTSSNADARSHAITPTLDGDTLYVAHDPGNEVTAINAETGTVTPLAKGISRPEETAVTRSGKLLWVSARGDNTIKRIDLEVPAITASVFIGALTQPESIMLTPSETTLVLSLRGSPASLGFVDTTTVDSATPDVEVISIAGAGTSGDLAVMTRNGHHVYATFDAGVSGKGGVAVVDVRTRTIVNSWEYPTAGRPHGIWYSRKKLGS